MKLRTLCAMVWGLLLVFAAQSASAALAVTSINNSRVYEFFGAFNETLRADQTSFPELFSVTGIDYRNNDLVVADTLKLNGRLLTINPGNTVAVLEGFPDVITPVGLAVDGVGDVYAANYLVSRVTRTTPFGVTSLFADATDGLNGPIGMSFDTMGNLYVADVNNKQIIKFDPFGVPTIFADASDGLFTPVDVDIDANGNVFVADTLLGGGRIWKFDSLGNGSIFADTLDGIVSPTGVAVDRQTGDVYVANYLIDTITQLDSLGNATLYANAADGIDGPWNLAFKAAVIPEPGSLVVWSLLGLAGVGHAVWRRRRSGAAA